MDLYIYIIAIIGGFLAGAINTLAGSGSAITLTILTELMGLPGNLANGTNRVGVMTQSLAGTYGFYREGKLQLARSSLYLIWTTLGAIVGVIAAVYISNEQFLVIFKFLMIAMLLLILIKPKRWLRETDIEATQNYWVAIPLFLAIGFYAGFIQMGMGVIFLAAMVLQAKYSLIDSNAIKVAVVAIYTVPVLAIFHWKGLIDWKIGGILAIGQTLGGYLTATFAAQHPQANVWAHRLLVTVILFALVKIFWF